MFNQFEAAGFSDLPEFGVGHATDEDACTGCTCFVARGDLLSRGAVCGVDVRGGGPATRETDLLKPENMVERVNAVMIGGGSAFGLEASCGAMDILVDNEVGFAVGPVRVPIVPAACLFDLLVGKPAWPDKKMGRDACLAALAQISSPAQGRVGAGCGATVGKMGAPDAAMSGGFGWSGARAGELVVISCVAVNAAGNIVAEDGSWLAGTRDASGNVISPLKAAADFAAVTAAAAGVAAIDEDAAVTASAAIDEATAVAPDASTFADAVVAGTEDGGVCANTTLGVVLTNARLTKAQATKVAQQTHDAYARAIFPVHTLHDGDTIFVMSSDRVDAMPDMVGIMACQTMASAIRSAVRHGNGL